MEEGFLPPHRNAGRVGQSGIQNTCLRYDYYNPLCMGGERGFFLQTHLAFKLSNSTTFCSIIPMMLVWNWNRLGH